MNRVENNKFRGEKVLLDDCHYEKCEFASCVFVYRATAAFSLVNNDISPDCSFMFEGAAADTVRTMQDIYRMGTWGRQMILNTFKQIAPGLNKLN